MQKIEKYVADDGKEFNSEDECLRHEKAAQILKNPATHDPEATASGHMTRYRLLVELQKHYRVLPLVEGKTQTEIQLERICRAIIRKIHDRSIDPLDPRQDLLKELLQEAKLNDAEREAFK
jgi:hypothetical protein